METSRIRQYLAANVAGIVLFIFFVERISYTIRIEERDGPDFGDSLEFLFTGVPVLALFTLVNLVWAARSLEAFNRARQVGSAKACAAVVIAWIATILALRWLP